ncbi:MAG: TetR/AcrR family transcriptional regulator [Alphaproteobacteria bacterium]|nr:TetR/AcrR family transcriptional regulator [Alphaproteobacteria bacterium]
MTKVLSPRSAAKRAAILDAAQVCFCEQGYAATSMDMVAASAGVSKATIYAHFANKDDLFGAIICRRCDDQAEGLGGLVLAAKGDGRTALAAIARALMDLFLAPEVMALYRVVVAESPRHPDLARIYYEQGPWRGKQRVAEVLAALDRQGQLVVPDPWQATDLFVNMLRGEVFHRALLGLEPAERPTAETTIAESVRVMLAAYGPHP